MSTQEQPRAGYYITGDAWYWVPACGDPLQFIVGLYYAEGTCEYEFSFNWNSQSEFYSLHLHDDGFGALADPRFVRLWAELASLGTRQLRRGTLVEILARCGIEDMTVRERP